MMRPFVFVLAILAALSGVAIGISAARGRHSLRGWHVYPQVSTTSSPSGKARARQSDDEQVIRFASNPQAVPSFAAKDLDGNAISPTDWKGKVVLLTFWATWCPPCREEIPMLVSLENRYKDRLEVVGVSIDDSSPDDVKQFAQKFGINYPVMMATPEIVTQFGGVPALPTMFVINQDGNVVQKHVGLYPESLYETEVRSLLGLPVDARVETFEDTGQVFLKNAARATELPDVDFSGLTPEQKKTALKRLNSESCNCGCTLTLAECRINDTGCPISKALAARIVKEVAAGEPATRTEAAPSSPAPKASDSSSN